MFLSDSAEILDRIEKVLAGRDYHEFRSLVHAMKGSSASMGTDRLTRTCSNLGGLSDEDRGYMPRSSVPPEDAFKQRFMTFMGPERGPAFYRSMALWNDAMAESVADFRAAHPDHRVLLVVGAFHVAGRLGTVTQFLARRPDDRARILVMQPTEGPMAATAKDRGEGDVVLKVRVVEQAPTN